MIHARFLPKLSSSRRNFIGHHPIVVLTDKEKFVNDGLNVVAVLDIYSDNKVLKDGESLAEELRNLGVRAVCPTTDFDIGISYILNGKLPSSICWSENIILLKDKAYLQSICQGTCFSVVTEYSCTDLKEGFSNFPLVLKKSNSSGGDGLILVNNMPELLALPFKLDRNWVVQEFIEGEEYSVDIVVQKHETKIIGLWRSYKQKTRNFIINDFKIQIDVNNELIRIIHSVIDSFLMKVDWPTGIFNLDLIHKGKDGWFLIDFNPRIGLTAMALNNEKFNVVDLQVDILCGGEMREICPQTNQVIYYLRTSKNAVVKENFSFSLTFPHGTMFNFRGGSTIPVTTNLNDSPGYVTFSTNLVNSSDIHSIFLEIEAEFCKNIIYATDVPFNSQVTNNFWETIMEMK